MIHLRNIRKSYPGSPEVLKDINITVHPGETVAVTGPSGCGKSTLMNIIGALDTPDAGTATVADVDISKLNDRSMARFRCRHIGFVFQFHHLLPQYTVLENILLPTLAPDGKRENARTRARNLLSRVGLQEKANQRPGTLSGGESQRVAVVRALINQPTILLADEPTGALNQSAATALVELLLELNDSEKMILLMVTHSLDAARKMAVGYELKNGRLG